MKDLTRIGTRNITGFLDYCSLEQDVEIGRRFSRRINRTVALVNGPVVAEYVNRIGQDPARNSDLKVPPTVRVVRDDGSKAFALPGGFLYFNTGLVLFAREEAEMAAVLGREIAHTAGRHGTRHLSRQRLLGAAAEVVVATLSENYRGTLITAAAANVALPLTFLNFSRSFEKKADLVGMRYLYQTGYDPLAIVNSFERPGTVKQDRGAAALRSHPPSAKRARPLQEAIDELLPDQPSCLVSGSEFDSIRAPIRRLH